jgi:DNA ligase-1
MVYNKTESAVMTVSGEPQFKLYVFDSIAMGLRAVTERLAVVLGMSDTPTIEIVQQFPVENVDDILFYEAWHHVMGFEGVCLRQFDSRYKHGRSTIKEGALLRVIREATDEATVVGFKEKMTNTNPQTVNERGYATRSSHQAYLKGANTLGALTVKSKKFRHEFDIGTGFTDAARKWIWSSKDHVLHRTIVFKYKPYGVKDRPRQPRFKGFRSLLDI